MNKQMLKHFQCKYNTVYVFILESKTSLKCVGWGNFFNFYQKYWNYYVVDYKNIYCDRTTTLILSKRKEDYYVM